MLTISGEPLVKVISEGMKAVYGEEASKVLDLQSLSFEMNEEGVLVTFDHADEHTLSEERYYKIKDELEKTQFSLKIVDAELTNMREFMAYKGIRYKKDWKLDL